MKSFCYTLFWAGRKIVQIGETERKQDVDLLSGTRSCASSKQRFACFVFLKRKTSLAHLLFLLSKSLLGFLRKKEPQQRNGSFLKNKKRAKRSLWRRRGEVCSKHKA